MGALYLALGIATLPAYGATWDECENLYAGEAHLHFLTSGDGRYLDFSKNQLEGAESALFWEYAGFPERYPPATNILAAASKHVLSDWLGWLAPLDAYHSMIVLLATLLVVCVAAVAFGRAGGTAALAAGLALGFHPRFFSDLHNNIKDVPEAVWYSLALLLAHRAHVRGNLRAWALASICFAMALATKANSLLWPVEFALWLVLDDRLRNRAERRAWRLTLTAGSAALVMSCALAVSLWPWLWESGLGALPSRIESYLAYVMRMSTGNEDFGALAPYYLLVVTPPWVVVLSALGIVKVVRDVMQRQDRDGFGLLLLVWLALPLFRLCLPYARFYDGIRHFLEVLPAVALLAGIGAAWLVSLIGQRFAQSSLLRSRQRAVTLALALCAVVGSVLPIVHYHPHENLYFNSFVGGYSGARARGLPWAHEYWSGSLREAVEWINVHGEPGFRIAAMNAGHLLKVQSVRPDLSVDPDPEAIKNLPLMAAQGRPMRYYVIETREPHPDVSDLGSLVHERLRDHGPVFRIFRIERATPRVSAAESAPRANAAPSPLPRL